jgi:hypothetical protein
MILQIKIQEESFRRVNAYQENYDGGDFDFSSADSVPHHSMMIPL